MIINLGPINSFYTTDYQASTYGKPMIFYLQFTTTFNYNMAGHTATQVAYKASKHVEFEELGTHLWSKIRFV